MWPAERETPAADAATGCGLGWPRLTGSDRDNAAPPEIFFGSLLRRAITALLNGNVGQGGDAA